MLRPGWDDEILAHTHAALISECESGSGDWITELGMFGLEILHQQQPDWAAKLTTGDAARAARYAMHSFNRFPKWFAALVAERQEAVDKIMRSEMEKDIRQFADNASHDILRAMLNSDETLGKFSP